jgi:hypothetical protein
MEQALSRLQNLIFHGKLLKILKRLIKKENSNIFGFQNCSPIEDDISLVEKGS